MYTTGVVGVSGFRLTIPARSAGLVCFQREQEKVAATGIVLEHHLHTPRRLLCRELGKALQMPKRPGTTGRDGFDMSDCLANAVSVTPWRELYFVHQT